ncbi:MAG: tRNA (guanosine(37)-N1)-methyltransferase TrmD [Kiritimatiellae bacterium]|nr:tRNA (guanosine(37)-N1)-methyltransferase TrmD [Kiritimatiellia bacterium]
MDGPLQIDIVTVFPDMLSGFLESSMLKRATKLGAARFNLVNLRDFAEGARRTTDDRPYGGGPGMVMLADPIVKAVESLAGTETKRVMMTPSGKRFDQCDAHRLSQERHLVFVCGHYEGIDDRVRQLLQPEELSIGDYVLTNGVLPAAVVIDAVVRLLPGVLGGEGATVDESFETGLLDFPQFTRPVEYRGLRVPEVLQSGNHAAIAAWRKAEAERITLERRPDLAARMGLPRPEPETRRDKRKRRPRRQDNTTEDLAGQTGRPSAEPGEGGAQESN